jgi:DNA-binding MarR family transcriptional regulator
MQSAGPVETDDMAGAGVHKTKTVEGSAKLAGDLRLAAGRLSRRLRQVGAGGLTVSQMSVLASVDRLGPVQLGELARVESVAAPTITRVVAALEERKLLRRRSSPDDRRAAIVELTLAGRRALTDVRGKQITYLVEALGRLRPDDRALLAEAVPLLDRLLDDGSQADR